MITALDIIGQSMARLMVVRDDRDYLPIDGIINDLTTAGNRILDHLGKHKCGACYKDSNTGGDNAR